jgi:hypothetical protein
MCVALTGGMVRLEKHFFAGKRDLSRLTSKHSLRANLQRSNPIP